jgi:hypothetical protein
MSAFLSVLRTLRTSAHSRAALQLEILALRHQLQVRQRTRPRRLRLATTDRCVGVMLSRLWTGWRTALVIVKPETVIAWQRRGFRLWWNWEEPVPHRATDRAGQYPDADSHDGASEPALGCPADSWRTVEIGDRRLSGDGRQIHGSPPPATIPDLAHVLAQSHRPDRGGRFLRRPDRHVPPLVPLGAPRARSATHPAPRSHRTSDGGVDGPTTTRGVPVGRGAALPAPLPRGHGD